ncbi:MAG: hypothetical protein OXG38_05935 [Chloroflexi bacterium]|nr:hypothetical protein [Chloroflexota bacterium]
MSRVDEILGLLKDPVGTLRCTWADTGWRFVLILAALIFILETASGLAGVEQGSAWWAGELLAAVIVALYASRHPLRGALTDTANMTVFLAIVLLLLAEAIITYTTISDTFAAQPIFWPFSLMLMGTAITARIVAPYVMHPQNLWLLTYAFLSFWLHTGMQVSELGFVEPPFTWALALTGAALAARWLVGGGSFGGPIRSRLNGTVAIYVFLLWWFEYGINESGIGSDPWGYQELYWPWLLSTLGLALAVRIVSPYIAPLLISGGVDDGEGAD